MPVRGVRGATVAAANTRPAIIAATRTLLQAMLTANPSLRPEDVASAIFTVTDDLDATYPALAARLEGWMEVPLLCGHEIPVPDGLARCIRILLHWNTPLPQAAINHVYLGAARQLRPELALQQEGLR